MDDFSYQSGSEAFAFQSFDMPAEASSGPYIPEVRDCMSCGVCLSSCPTYKVRPEENYGPRGRIRLIERVIKGEEALDLEALQALDACTLCRACEKVCPSKMAYSQLYLQAIEGLSVRPKRELAIDLVFRLVDKSRSRPRLLNKLLRFYQWSGVQRTLRRNPILPLKGGLAELDRLLPKRHKPEPVPEFSPADKGSSQGKIGLFTGCIANIFDSKTHNASIRLLTRLGYDVSVVENQTCCGATYAHNGDVDRARACARQNISAFSAGDFDAIVYNSSGCGAFLGEYPNMLDTDRSDVVFEDKSPATDILVFLATEERLSEVRFAGLNTRVAVHESCSQRNAIGNAALIYDLLGHVPDLDIVSLPGNEMCCGAGGTKMLTQPELASPPRDEKVTALLQTSADILISTNLTCAMHMASGIHQMGQEIKVIHPVQLLAQQMI